MKFTINAEQLMEITHRLKKSGNFEKYTDDPTVIMDDDYTFESYSEAKQWKQAQSKVEIDDLEIEANPTSIGLGRTRIAIRGQRINKPKQKVFTKEQLRNVLLQGDDSVKNSLVIDKEGYIQLVPFERAKDAGYPVRFETFHAGNGYVGSEYDSNELENLYLTLLEGWVEHLTSGDTVYRDYSTGRSEEELFNIIDEKILKYQ